MHQSSAGSFPLSRSRSLSPPPPCPLSPLRSRSPSPSRSWSLPPLRSRSPSRSRSLSPPPSPPPDYRRLFQDAHAEKEAAYNALIEAATHNNESEGGYIKLVDNFMRTAYLCRLAEEKFLTKEHIENVSQFNYIELLDDIDLDDNN